MWLLTLAIVVSCLIDVIFTILLLTSSGTCAVIVRNKYADAAVFIVQRVTSLLIFVWASIIVFWPRNMFRELDTESHFIEDDFRGSGMPKSHRVMMHNSKLHHTESEISIVSNSR